MKHLYCIALIPLLLFGCTQTTEPPSHVTAEPNVTVNVTESASVETTPVEIAPEETIPIEATPVEAAEATPNVEEHWQLLFDRKSLAGWSVPVYGGDGNVDVQEGNIVIGRGEMMTGIRYDKEFPKIDYEIRYEARRTQGYDFFAACTFPVKESFCTLINGGWGGGLTGLSSVDGSDASENQTSTFYDYRENTWYRFRIQVQDDAIQVWITTQDGKGNWGEEKSIIEIETAERELTTRYEMDKYKPLGFCTWVTEGQLRNIEYRMIEQ